MSFKNLANPSDGNDTDNESLPNNYSMQSEVNDGCKVLSDEADANATECCACTENLYQVAFPMNCENNSGGRTARHTNPEEMDQIELSEEAGIYVVSANAITNTKPDPKAALMSDQVERSDYVKQQSKKKSRKKDRREQKRRNKQKGALEAGKKSAYDVRSILKTSDDQKSTRTSSSSGSEASFAATDDKVNILRRRRKDREDRVCHLALMWMAGLTTVAALVITGTLLGYGFFEDGDPASRTPSSMPSLSPSASPTAVPTTSPSLSPSSSPSLTPSIAPSTSPSSSPSAMPSALPSMSPTSIPTFIPTASPSSSPSSSPSLSPSSTPSYRPSLRPSVNPTSNPSSSPSLNPSSNPSMNPTSSPTETRGAILFGVGEDPFRRNSAAGSVSNNFYWKTLVLAVAIWGLF